MKKWLVIAILAVAQFVMVLDSTVMNVSISAVAADLNTTITGMQVAITMYALTMAALMLTGGKLGSIWGRHKAFKIGSVIYGAGSLITALSPSLPVLFLGWSIVEGLGAILVIPAIASLAAINYAGKSRVIAFSILGAVTGLAAAAGPIIGGLFTTYLSWRYVFAGETLIMAIVLLMAGRIKDESIAKKSSLDIPSSVLSAVGLGLIVLGILQSKTWGWIQPKASPIISGQEIEPLGVSLTAYFILAGVLIMYAFFKRQKQLEAANREPLLKTSLLKIPVLRSGLAVFLSQYFIIASLFFVVPVYLQTILGYNAIETGVKLLPLSFGLIIFSVIGSKMTNKHSSKTLARIGQLGMAAGTVVLLGGVGTELKGVLFGSGMFIVGAGFGLLASQLGNVNMSAVSQDDTPEVGGLQGTYQNFGTSLGTALVGSVFIMALSTGFIDSVNANPNVSQSTKSSLIEATQTNTPIVSEDYAKQSLQAAGVSTQETNEIVNAYREEQIVALQQALFFVFAAALMSLALSRNMPSSKPGN